LLGRQLTCPGCTGVLAPWGFARPRGVRGVGSLRPRRARCLGCLVTHVLLPVTVLLRRADAVEVIGAALTARAAGSWASPDRGVAGCAGRNRTGLAAAVGLSAGTGPGAFHRGGQVGRVDQSVPKATGSPWRDVLAAVGAATTAVTTRFGTAGVLGPVTAWQVAATSSGSRLLSPGWPLGAVGAGGNTSSP
jgi:hypothetical protein